MPATYLCSIADIPEGTARGFDPELAGRDTVFVVRSKDRAQAWLNSCPHVPGSPLAWRKDAFLSGDGQTIVCYGHGAQFDIETGTCTKGPCLGQPLTSVALDLDPEGGLILPSFPINRFLSTKDRS